MTEKLQKVLARAGVGSRRTIETWIAAGRVQVNGQVAHIGDRVDTNVRITVDGKPIRLTAPVEFTRRVLLYHKPEGEICARRDPEGRPTVFERLPKRRGERWVNIGRLDFNTAGLLLFTNDGELANKLMHPRYEVEREYAVRIFGSVTEEMLRQLKKGVMLEDGLAKFAEVDDAGGEGSNHWYHVVVTEGKNRLVRRLWESQNVTVSRLIRLRYGSIALPRNLRQGHYVELTEKAVNELMQTVSKTPKK